MIVPLILKKRHFISRDYKLPRSTIILLQAYIALNMTETQLFLKSLGDIRISVLTKDIMVPK